MVCALTMLVQIAGSFTTHFGRFWFFFPNQMMFMNDSSAYFCGRAFGRHKLIGLSPNKTVEGFVGAMLVNILFAFFFTWFYLAIGPN